MHDGLKIGSKSINAHILGVDIIWPLISISIPQRFKSKTRGIYLSIRPNLLKAF